MFDDETFDKFNNTHGNNTHKEVSLAIGQYVTYTNTNANIDFTQSWEYRTKGKIVLISCNFVGTDLSKNDMSSVQHIYNCLLHNTNLLLPSSDKVLPSFTAMESSFSGLDLSTYTLDAKEMVMDGVTHFNYDCQLDNTRAKIINYTKDMQDYEGFDLLSTFNSYLKEGYYDGCYINGKLWKSFEENQITAQEKRQEYEKMKADLIHSTTQSIEQQISGFGKK